MANLQAQIDGRQRQALAGGLDVGRLSELIELVALRGHLLGCVADYNGRKHGPNSSYSIDRLTV